MKTIHESRFLVKPGKKVRLNDYDTSDASLMPDKAQAKSVMLKDIARLEELQERLWAENRRSLLVVLQGMDASGKDGTIKHVMSGLNPQGCAVTSFKAPSAEELDHDFLWRIHRSMPRKGEIGVFNRSHYEDVLAVRVHKLVAADIWESRFSQINRFEEVATELGTVILKFFLHVGKDEQKKRMEERLASPRKNWKFSAADLDERKLWKDYQAAYEDILSRCSTKAAPWYIVPADHKWYRNGLVARAIVEKLESLNPRYPPPQLDLAKIHIE